MARPQLHESEVQQFREDVAEAALRTVEEEGLDSLTLRRLAKRLGCSYAKPYSYYRNKEQLIDAVRGRGFDLLSEFMTRELASDAPVSGDAYVRFALENPETFRVMFALRQDYVSDETREKQARAWGICSQPIRDAVAAGEFEGDPELIAHVAWTALHGLASLALANQFRLGKTVDEVGAGLARMLDGFRPVAARGE